MTRTAGLGPAVTSLLKTPDMDDRTNVVVTIRSAETKTGQTMVIDSGRYFH